jgi:hypothetical protein
MSTAVTVGWALLFAAVFLGLITFLWFDRPAENSSRRYRVHPRVVLRSLFAAACAAGGAWLALHFEAMHRPLLAGLALASVVPAMIVVAITLLGFAVLLFAPATPTAETAPVSRPVLSAHDKTKGRVRGAILVGMITMQCVLMPVYGGETGFTIGLTLAAAAFVISNKVFAL